MAETEVEVVEAQTLKVGDFIFFPNSRHAQKVEQIVEAGAEISVVGDDVTWKLTPGAPVRKLAQSE